MLNYQKDSDNNKKDDTMKKIIADSTNMKLIGRVYMNDDTLWLGMSGSGVEFRFKGKGLTITLCADEVYTGERKDFARAAVYINGSREHDLLFDQQFKTVTVSPDGECVIRIIKLSECAMGNVGIKPILADDDDSIVPVEDKAHKIEFIGDSITCGYGVDDENELHPFMTETEDVTKGFAYKTAEALGYDYSMFSLSGYGIISGYTDDGTRHEDQLVPRFYESYGFSIGSFGGIKPMDIDWDFRRYVPDIIVINLGTNDDSYCGSDEGRQNFYSTKYTEFLHVVRKHNPNAHIICALGVMGDNLFPALERAVDAFMKETGDRNITLLHFTPQNGELDGYAANYHPTEKTHTKAAASLTDVITLIQNR